MGVESFDALLGYLSQGPTIRHIRAAASAIKNITRIASDDLKLKLVDDHLRFVPSLVNLLSGKDNLTLEYSLEALQHLSLNLDLNQQTLWSSGALSPLLSLLRAQSALQQQYAAGTLMNMSKHHFIRAKLAAKSDAISALIMLLTGGTDIQKQYAVATLRNLGFVDNITLALSDLVPNLLTLINDGTDAAMEYASLALENVLESTDPQVLLTLSNQIHLLVGMLREEERGDIKPWALRAIFNLSKIPHNCSRLTEKVAIDSLNAFLEVRTPERLKVDAAGVITNLVMREKDMNFTLLVESDELIPRLIALFNSDHPILMNYALITIRYLSGNTCLCFVDTIDKLVDLLAPASTDLQKRYAASTLLNLLVHKMNQKKVAKRHDAIPWFVGLLHNNPSRPNLLSAAIHAIQLISENSNFHEDLEREGVIAPLVSLLSASSLHQQQCAVAAMKNLSISEKNQVIFGKLGAIPRLIKFIREWASLHRQHALGALFNLSLHADNQTTLAKEDIVETLLHSMNDRTARAREYAVGTISNLSFRQDCRDILTRKMAFRLIAALMLADNQPQNQGSDLEKQYAVCVIQNLASDAGTVGKDVISHLLELILSHTNLEEQNLQQQYAAGAIHNLLLHRGNHNALVEKGVIPCIIGLLGELESLLAANPNIDLTEEMKENDVKKNRWLLLERYAVGAIYSLSRNPEIVSQMDDFVILLRSVITRGEKSVTKGIALEAIYLIRPTERVPSCGCGIVV
jgi:hypothetical protein